MKLFPCHAVQPVKTGCPLAIRIHDDIRCIIRHGVFCADACQRVQHLLRLLKASTAVTAHNAL